MFYQGSEFSIRPFRKGDESSLALNANNFEVSKYLDTLFPFPYTYDDACSWIEMNQDQPIHYNLAIVVDGDVVGGIGLIPGQGIHEKSAAIGYWLGQNYWGKGIMTQACKQMVNYSFEKFEYNRLWAYVFGENQASGKVLEKCGFKHEATLTKAIYKNNTYHDEFIYSLLRNAWIENK